MSETAKKAAEPTQPVKKPTIWEAIPMITGAVSPIEKNRQGTGVPFKFRGIDDVYAALNLLLAAHGVCILPEILESKHEVAGTSSKGTTMYRHMQRVRFHLYASDGTTITADAEGEGMDSGDKAVGKAASTAYKSMAFQVFCIPTGEKIDSEEESPEVEAKPAEPAKPLDDSQALCTKLAQRMAKAKDAEDLAVAQADYTELAMQKKITEKQVDWLEGIMKKQLERIGKEGK